MPVRKPITPEEIAQMKKELIPLEQTFELLDVHIVITDREGNILYANKAAQRITGFSLAEMLGKNPGDLWGGHEKDALYAQMWKTIKEDKKPFVCRVTNRKKAGAEFVQELHITPLLDERGEVKYFVSMEPDVTQQVVVEKHMVDISKQRSDLMVALSSSEHKISDLLKQINQMQLSTSPGPQHNN